MDRREFFQSLALTTAVAQALPVEALAAPQQSQTPDTSGHTLQCEFQYNNTAWKVYEDLSKRDGSITFVPARGAARMMTKRPEAVFSQAAVPFLGLSQQDIGNSLPDILADKLLAGGGDPDEIQVRDASPLSASTRRRSMPAATRVRTTPANIFPSCKGAAPPVTRPTRANDGKDSWAAGCRRSTRFSRSTISPTSTW